MSASVSEPVAALAARITQEWRSTLAYAPGRGWLVLDEATGTWTLRGADDVARAIALQDPDGGDPDLARRLAEMPERATWAERRAVRRALRAWVRKSPAMQRVTAALELAAPLLAEGRA